MQSPIKTSHAVLAATILALCATGAPAAALETQQPAIANFAQVSPTVFRGALPGRDDLPRLKQLGITTIVDLRMHDDKEEESGAKAQGIEYIHLPMGYWAPSTAKVEQALNILTDPRRGRIYVHCRQGADRTGTIVGIYRILVQRWSFQRTYTEMRAHHFKPWWFALRERVETISQRNSQRNNQQNKQHNDQQNEQNSQTATSPAQTHQLATHCSLLGQNSGAAQVVEEVSDDTAAAASVQK